MGDLSRKKIEDLISAADRILKSQKEDKKNVLFNDLQESSDALKQMQELLTDPELQHDPKKSYDLYYGGIQQIIFMAIPEKSQIRDAIFNLKCTLIAGKELKNVSSGKRGADSRMETNERLEYVADILMEWSNTPDDYFKLAYMLLEKCKEMGISPQEREISDFAK